MSMHIHAALIKAWAEGAEIEVQIDGVWTPCSSPTWSPHCKYRLAHSGIKVRYRVALMRHRLGTYTVSVNDEQREKATKESPGFVSWLTPWTETKVHMKESV